MSKKPKDCYSRSQHAPVIFCRKLQILLVVSALCYCSGLGHNKEEEELIGWKGETFEPKRTFSDPDNSNEATSSRDDKAPWVQVLSWKPRAFVYHNFLTTSEVRHVLELSAYQMKRSMVVGANDTGVVDDVRTSAGMFINRNYDPVITGIEERLAMWSQLPPSHQEDMQVLRYGPTNKYGAHCDGLGRVMSVLIYLIAPEEGGETAFPESNGWLHPEVGEPTQGPFSPCAKGHVAYKPKQGDALMFFDRTVDYLNEDPNSMHTGCPVIKGVKWNAVKWIHGKPFHPDEWAKSIKDKYPPMSDPGTCDNLHEMCEQWASQGECQKNPGYMVGKPDGRGNCRMACKDCVLCKDGDEECRNKNRETGGFLMVDKSEFGGLLG